MGEGEFETSVVDGPSTASRPCKAPNASLVERETSCCKLVHAALGAREGDGKRYTDTKEREEDEVDEEQFEKRGSMDISTSFRLSS